MESAITTTIENGRGRVVAGTVGRPSSGQLRGRLVVVERVTKFAAFLRELPEQRDNAGDDVITLLVTPRATAMSPYAEFEAVDPSTLSIVNRAAVTEVTGAPVRLPDVERITTHDVGKLDLAELPVTTSAPAAESKRERPYRPTQRVDRAVRLRAARDEPPNARDAIIWRAAVAFVAAPLDAIVERAITDPNYSRSKTPLQDARWRVRTLVASGYLEVVLESKTESNPAVKEIA